MAAVLQEVRGLSNMAEIGEYIHAMYLGCCRFGWQALGLAWVLCILGWVLTFSPPDVYESSTRLYVDTASRLRPLLKGLAVEPDVMSEVNLMMRAIQSNPSLEEIARRTGLDLHAGAATPAGIEGLGNRNDCHMGRTIDRNKLLDMKYTKR